MPKRGWRSEQARAQWTSGNSKFGSGCFDDDIAAKLRDPDFEPCESDEDSDSASDSGEYNHTFKPDEGAIEDSGWESDDSESEGDVNVDGEKELTVASHNIKRVSDDLSFVSA
jgi:hypothetical protein